MKRRILLVDDELPILLTLKAVLELHGFEVTTAESSQEAAEKLRSGVYQMVITDMRMETENAGYDVIRVAKEQQYNPATAILDLTPVGSIDISPATVQGLARSDPAFPPSRLKFIVAPTDHLYGMSRMYQLIGERIRPRLQVVRSLAEAYATLGVKDLHFEPVPGD